MDLVEPGVQGVDEGDVEAVLPDDGGVLGVVAVLVPGAVGRDREIARADLQLLAVDDGPGAGALVDEAQGGGLVAVGGHRLAGAHDLEPGVEEPGGGADVLAAGVDEHHNAAAGVVGLDHAEGLVDQGPQLLVAPQHGNGLGLRVPGFDVVGDGPQRAGVQGFELAVVRGELGGVEDPGAAEHGVVLRGGHTSSSGVVIWGPAGGAVKVTGRRGRLSTSRRKMSKRL